MCERHKWGRQAQLSETDDRQIEQDVGKIHKYAHPGIYNQIIYSNHIPSAKSVCTINYGGNILLFDYAIGIVCASEY